MNRRRLIIGLVVLGLLSFLAFPLFEHTREVSVRGHCQSNLKRIGLGIGMYIRDYDETYPPPRRWRTVIQPYVFGWVGEQSHGTLKQLDCPLENTGYAYNFFLKSKQYESMRLPQGIPIVFDSTDLSAQNYPVKPSLKLGPRGGTLWTYGNILPQKPDYGGSYPKDFRHPEGNNVLFFDGHVALLSRKPNFAIK